MASHSRALAPLVDISLAMVRDRIDALSHHLSDQPKASKMSTPARVFQLIPGVQSYDWGIQGSKEPRVAQFAAATKQLNFTADNDKPYAELWMGTHPSMPSRIIPNDASASSKFAPLAEYLTQHPELIGDRVRAKFSDDEPGALPFLFKVLSVGKALSIQAHPDKALGKKLHAQRPDVYKDPNHKPEMAIALTPFRGFCGFRPLAEIVEYIKNVPELAQLVQLSDDELARAIETGSSLSLEETSNAPPGFGDSSVKDISGHLESQTGVSVAEQALAEPTPQIPPSTNNRSDGIFSISLFHNQLHTI